MPILDPEFLDLTANLDVDAFWAENERCFAFTADKPRCAATFSPDDHWIFEFMNVPSTSRYYQDKTYRDDLHREVNALTLAYIGRAFFDEDTFQHQPKRIENLFGSEFAYLEQSTPWLSHVTEDPDEFARRLDTAESIEMEMWALPQSFLDEWTVREAEGRSLPKLGTGSRGPATVITSVLNPELALFWMYDHPALMSRFTDILGRKMVELNQVLREFSENQSPGWWITDDNSALFSPDLYHTYCYPVLERVLGAMAPGDARRHQHSDSSMGHLIDQQLELGINAVNYGPEVDAGIIRRQMPHAVIEGQLPPFLLRNGSPEAITQRIVDDFEKAGASGGLIVTTAGSLAAGTGVGRMRYFMQVVQETCRYD